MIIRNAKLEDISQLTEIGTQCYSNEESITEDEYKKRVEAYPNNFWILEEDTKIVAFINGPQVNENTIIDDMFHEVSYHDQYGKWQAILGVNTAPEFQKKGYASILLDQMLKDVKNRGCKGCILTCKKELLEFYERFGFKKLGISKSCLASQVWYDMYIIF